MKSEQEVKVQGQEEKKIRYRESPWCSNCEKEVGHCCHVCPDCGSTHLGGDLHTFAVVKDEWVPCDKVWYKPSTWAGGTWKCIGIHSRI